jgi:hypothetical protein
VLRDDNHEGTLAGQVGTVLPLTGHNPPWGYVVLEVVDAYGVKRVWYVHRRHVVVVPG